jgi:hypothetical protein
LELRTDNPSRNKNEKKKGRDVNLKFISSVFFPNDAGQFLGNFQLPGENERLGNYGGLLYF